MLIAFANSLEPDHAPKLFATLEVFLNADLEKIYIRRIACTITQHAKSAIYVKRHPVN